MIVEKILKQITPSRMKNDLAAIKKIKLPPKLQKWAREYEKIGGRDGFIWKLFLKAKREINCMPVKKPYRAPLMEINFLITMFVVLLDDVADKNQNKKLLNKLIKVPLMKNSAKYGKFNKKEKDYLSFTVKVWERINQLVIKSPLYEKFKDMFKRDINQMIRAINRDCFINKNHCAINKTDYWLHSPHAMQFIIGAAVNLMHLSVFVPRELKIVGEIAWQGQKMARVGNCVSTWEREINDNDFSSGVFAYAIDSGTLTVQDLTNANRAEIIKKIKKADIEGKLLKEWEKARNRIFYFWERKKIKTMNIKKFIKGLDNLLALEMISKNHK